MRKINNNDHDLEGDEGEIITVLLNSTGAPPLVNFELPGATWSEGPTAAGGRFTLKDNRRHRVGLDLLFTFEAATSDVYHVVITGSKGGPPSTTEVKRQTAPTRAVGYDFDIIPAGGPNA